MNQKTFVLMFLLVFMVACGSSGSAQIPIAELPDPAIYALNISELPEVGVSWQQTYNQTSTEAGYKWSYLAYQAYQPGNLNVELPSAYGVNNDVVLYETDVSHQDLPQPPTSMGNVQDIAWKSVAMSQRLGDKSAEWKTTVGEMLTPIWWLEFYRGHAYVRISLLGFPDQIAPSILYGLGDIIASRLPKSSATLRSDAATQVATPTTLLPTTTPAAYPTSGVAAITLTPTVTETPTLVIPLSYIAPPGERGMVNYFDETGSQLVDGVSGNDDILVDNGQGTAYEWVGWTDATDPVTLTFTLPENSKLSAVQIGFNHRDGLGVFVPSRVTINGLSFEPDAQDVPNNQRKDLTFNGTFSGPTVQITLDHRGRGWIMVDEIRFIAEK